MIKAVAATDQGTIVFLGLSRKNTELLLDNKPIQVKLNDLDPRLPELSIVLLGGETEADIAEDLRALGPNAPGWPEGGL